jgi:hypothetical protein
VGANRSAFIADSALHLPGSIGNYGAVQQEFNRPSEGRYRDSSGVIQTATDGWQNGVRGLRHAHYIGLDRTTLLEKGSTNLLTYSEDMTNGVWNTVNSSVSSNVAVAPDGATTADKLVEDNTTNLHRLRNDYVGPVPSDPTAIHTASIYAKAVERDEVQFFIFQSVTGHRIGARFNLTTGTIVSSTTTGATSTLEHIEDVGNGWYRLMLAGTFTTADSLSQYIDLYDAGGNQSYVGDGTSGVLLWGSQLEEAAAPSSYIPTTSAAATRAAGSFSQKFGAAPQEMTVYVDYVEQGTIEYASEGARRLFQIGSSSASADARLLVYSGSDPAKYTTLFDDGSAEVFATPNSTPSVGDRVEYRVALRTSDIQSGLSLNSAAEVTATTGHTGIPASWASETKFWLNGVGTNDALKGQNAFVSVKVFSGERDVAYCRANRGDLYHYEPGDAVAELSITEDIEVEVDLTLADWSPTTEARPLAQWQDVPDRSWAVAVGTTSFLSFYYTTDGSTTLSDSSSAAISVPNGERRILKYTVEANPGGSYSIRFYIREVSGNFSEVGVAQTGTGFNMYNSPNQMLFGTVGTGSASLDGQIHSVIVRSGVGGTEVLNVQFGKPAYTTEFDLTTGGQFELFESSVDTSDPVWLPYDSAGYLYFPGTASNTITVPGLSATTLYNYTITYDDGTTQAGSYTTDGSGNLVMGGTDANFSTKYVKSVVEDGSTAFDVDFTVISAYNALRTTITEQAAAATVTIGRSATGYKCTAITDRGAYLFATNDYLSADDDDGLDFPTI